jgi:hypothetical protein
VVNALATAATDNPGWWQMTTLRGTGQLRIRGDAATGLEASVTMRQNQPFCTNSAAVMHH